MKQRVLVDTSTLVSAALRAGSKPDQALKLVLDKCELCISAETLSELEIVLARQQFGRYISWEARQAFVDSVRTNGSSELRTSGSS